MCANVGRLPLARCIADPTCLANLGCIQTCTDRPDEAECQIKCGDEFSNDVVGSFTKCAVSDTGCVPQRADDNSWPVPQDAALVKEFNTEYLEGSWYISAGLNKAFDTFDCQLHKFEAPTPTKLVGNLQVRASRVCSHRCCTAAPLHRSLHRPLHRPLYRCAAEPPAARYTDHTCILRVVTPTWLVLAPLQWRIKDPIAGTNFVTRYTVQEFKQDSVRPGILYNHDNDFLHYEDDWYVLAAKKNEYVLVYYRGNNDAWDGYGGAVVYTPTPALNPKYFPELDEALQKVGRRWSEFTLTDNSCRAAETKLEELENDLVFVETRVASGIQTAESKIVKEIEKDLTAAEREVQKDIKLVKKEIVKDITIIEKDIEEEEEVLVGGFKKLFAR